MKLFIHRWFGGSAHPKVLFLKGKQWNYPRLANYAVPMMAGAIITGGHLIFVVGFCLVVPLFLYTAWNPLSLEEWYECYRWYWENRGYQISEFAGFYAGINHPNGTTRFNRDVTQKEAIEQLFFEIYGKWPVKMK